MSEWPNVPAEFALNLDEFGIQQGLNFGYGPFKERIPDVCGLTKYPMLLLAISTPKSLRTRKIKTLGGLIMLLITARS